MEAFAEGRRVARGVCGEIVQRRESHGPPSEERLMHPGEVPTGKELGLRGEARDGPGVGDDQIIGDDTLLAGGGNDIIFGGDGLDTISGGLGNDTILGGAGNDTFAGYDGYADSMSGGDGNDYFEYVAYSDGVDTISGGGGAGNGVSS